MEDVRNELGLDSFRKYDGCWISVHPLNSHEPSLRSSYQIRDRQGNLVGHGSSGYKAQDLEEYFADVCRTLNDEGINLTLNRNKRPLSMRRFH